jgi:ribose/xylose/arabinose/galactoside ABC-type transport system permease subunit
MSEGQPISIREAMGDSFKWLGGGDLLGIPVPVWLLLGIAGVASFILNYTPFGRQVYAVGDNEEAARLSGISVGRVTFMVYVISGLMAAVSSLILVSRLTTGHPDQGSGFELDAIAIVVIGGTSLFGGEGNIRGTLIGAAIVAVLANLLNLLGVSPFTQQIVKGLIIVGAVLFERFQSAIAERR